MPYANVNVPTCGETPAPAEPGTLKETMMEAANTLERVNHMLDVIWSFIDEPGMDMDKPPRCYGDCLLATANTTNVMANELLAKVERICKALGV